jgi:hypothetical protein
MVAASGRCRCNSRVICHRRGLFLVLLLSRAGRSAAEVPSTGLLFDYVLYLGTLTWSVDLTYVETRLHLLTGEIYLVATAIRFFFPA